MIRKIKKEVGCSFKENIQYMDHDPSGRVKALTLSAWETGDRWKRIGILLH